MHYLKFFYDSCMSTKKSEKSYLTYYDDKEKNSTRFIFDGFFSSSETHSIELTTIEVF